MLVEARLRLEELLRDVVQRPEVAGPLALRNYAYFVDFQRKELNELCREMALL